jgi:hypothetical protein
LLVADLFNPQDFIWFLVRHQEVLKNRALPVPSEFFDHLKVAWEELSFAYKALDPEQSLAPAVGKPGYLVTRCGDWIVFVPWPLVVTFPGPRVLANLLDVGRYVSIPPARNLCISGSSAWLGGRVVVGDIDYCQYVDNSPATIAKSSESFTSPTKERALVRASYGEDEAVVARPPWSETWSKLSSSMAVDSRDNARRFMLDFVGVVESMGLMPISCVVLASNFADRTRGAAKKSFVFQEAIAFEGDAAEPPWSLVDPDQLGDYLFFLREKARELIGEKPLKAVKRALSLAHTIRLDDCVKEGISILRSPAAAAYVSAARTKELHFELHPVLLTPA